MTSAANAATQSARFIIDIDMLPPVNTKLPGCTSILLCAPSRRDETANRLTHAAPANRLAAFAWEAFMREMRSGWAVRAGVSVAVVAGSEPALPVTVTPVQTAAAPHPGGSGFSPQLRLGFHVGDQWEPAIAADDHGSVYVLYPQYGGVPGCPASVCASPTAILQVSRDRGATWESPHPVAPSGTEQVDTQIVVDPVDGRTLFASWLQNRKSDTVVARSTDLGNSWSVVVADHTNAGTDKPILAARGQDVYVAYDHTQTVLVSSSHDAGTTFTTTKVNANANLGWSLACGGTLTPGGSVYFSWAGYTQNGGAKGPVNLYLSKSTDGGATWTNRVLDVSEIGRAHV